MKRVRRLGGLMIGVAMLLPAVAVHAAVPMVETGSSLIYPLFNAWVPDYTRMHPEVRINTTATGSGTGIAQAVSGIVQFGASDAYLSDALMKKYPGTLNIPVAVSSQMVNYNVPGLNAHPLRFSGPLLADIYEGKIRYWDNPALARMNPGVRLPHHVIVPIHRADGSGDSFLFTQFLSAADASWRQQVGYGTTVSWPAFHGAVGAIGNSGMVTALQSNSYSMAYVGISYRRQIHKMALGEAALKNRAGRFVMISDRTVAAAAAALAHEMPADGRLSLVFAPGDTSYPIINYEYVIVRTRQPSSKIATAVRQFLAWAVDDRGGNAPRYMKQVHFLPLPPPVRKQALAQIDRIHG